MSNSPLNIPRILVYGDSIAEGYNATTRETLGWVGRLRVMGYDTYRDAASGRRLVTDLTSLSDVQTRVRQWLRIPGLTDVIITIGTNDCFASESLTTFSTRYGQLLDELESRAPHVSVWAQSPIRRSGEGAVSPKTLQEFRDEISTLCGSRSRVTYIDAYPIVDPNTDLDDGTHPTDAGHLKYAQAIEAYLDWDRP